MKPIVYIDILFLINFLIDSTMIYATSLILKRSIHIFRLILSSSIMALYAVIMFFPQLSLMYSLLFKMLFLFCIVRIAFPTKKHISVIKNTVIFFAINTVFGGITFTLIFLTEFGIVMSAVISNGEIYFNISAKTLLFSAILAYVTVYVLAYVRKCGIRQKKLIFPALITFNDTKISVKALADTGCMAEDTLSKAPIIIISCELAEKIIPKEFINAMDRNFSEPEDEKYIKKFRIIPYNTIESSSFMNAFVADSVTINDITITGMVVGIAKNRLSKDFVFDAVFNTDILSNYSENKEVSKHSGGFSYVKKFFKKHVS